MSEAPPYVEAKPSKEIIVPAETARALANGLSQLLEPDMQQLEALIEPLFHGASEFALPMREEGIKELRLLLLRLRTGQTVRLKPFHDMKDQYEFDFSATRDDIAKIPPGEIIVKQPFASQLLGTTAHHVNNTLVALGIAELMPYTRPNLEATSKAIAKKTADVVKKTSSVFGGRSLKSLIITTNDAGISTLTPVDRIRLPKAVYISPTPSHT